MEASLCKRAAAKNVPNKQIVDQSYVYRSYDVTYNDNTVTHMAKSGLLDLTKFYSLLGKINTGRIL